MASISKVKMPGDATLYTIKDASAVASLTLSGTALVATMRDGSQATTEIGSAITYSTTEPSDRKNYMTWIE